MSSAPAASAAAASPSPAAAPSSNTRRNYYRRSTNTSAATAANDSVQDSTNRIIKNTVFDIGATATPDQFRRTLLAIESYVQTNYTDAGDVVLAIRNLAPPSALIPPALPVRDPANPDLYQIHVIHYDVAYKANAAAERKYKSHLVNAWGLIYGQCTTALKSKLEGMTDFTTAKATNDIIALLKLIQGLCCKFDVKSQKYVALAATFRQTFVYFQDNNCSNVDFYHHYKSLLATVQAFGGDNAIGVIPNFVEDELEVIVTRDGTTIDLATDDQKSEAKTKSQERFLAATMLGCTNLTKYEPMRRHLENQFAMGNDNYPQTLEGVFDLMNTFNNGPPTAPSRPRPTYSAAAASATAPDGAAMFAQSSEDIICHDCGRRGHIQRHCPDRPSNRRNTATNATANATNASATNQPAPPNAKLANVHIHTMINEDYYEGRTTDAAIFFQNSATGMLNPNLILLDSCSSHHQFCNPNLVRNIRHTNFPIKVHCNAGTKITTQEADLDR